MTSGTALRRPEGVGAPPRAADGAVTIRVLAGIAGRVLAQNRPRALSSVLVAALAVVLLMAGLSLSTVAQTRGERTAARSPVAGVAASTADDLLFVDVGSYYLGREVSAQRVAVRGATDLLPAGLTRLPAPGELAVSPAMQRLLDDPATTMAQRYPGRVTQIIGDDGLLGPDELVVWIGARPGDIGASAVPIRDFGTPAQPVTLPAELRPAQALLVVGFLIPLLALLVTCATVGGAQRDQRLAALRLLGLTARQAKLMTAVEAGLMAVAGVLAGVAAFLALRPVLAPLVPVDGGVWPADVPTSWPTVLCLLLLVPLLAVAASAAALRSVTVEPLSIVRRSAGTAPSLWRLVPLLGGTALLATALAANAVDAGSGTQRSLTVIAGVGACTLGLLLASSVVAHRASRLLERCSASTAAFLGLRQAQVAAVGAARSVTGLACMVFVSGLLLSFFPLLSDASASARARLAEVSDSSLLVAGVQPGAPVAEADLRAASSLAGSALMRQVAVRTDGGGASAVWVGDCAQVSSVLGIDRADCARGVALDVDPLSPSTALQAVDMVVSPEGFVVPTPVGPAFTAPSRPAHSAYLSALAEGNSLPVSGFLPTSALPPGLRAQLQRFPGTVVAQPRAGEVEAARTALVRATGGSAALTTGESLAIAEKDTRTFRGLTLAAFVSGVLVAGLSLFVATADQVREQRRVRQTLWVIGVPRRMAGRALWTQVAVTTVPVLILASGLSILAAKAFVDLADSPPALPWLQLAATLAGALAAPLVTTLVVRRWLRPDLRSRLSIGS